MTDEGVRVAVGGDQISSWLPKNATGQIWLRARSPERNFAAQFGLVADDLILFVDGSPFGDWKETGTRIPLRDVGILPPVIPPTLFACGINYTGHAVACSKEFERPIESFLPISPQIGYRAQSAIIAAGETIVIPADAPENVQCEGELGVVIGKPARKVRAEDALDYVLGYTVCNDVSAREWQFADRTFWRAKNSDTFKPIGPCISTGVDIADMTTNISLNGQLVGSFATGNMLYSVAEYIEAITCYITLQPGDVIMMGTDGKSPRIAHGNTIEVAIEGVGRLVNPVVREGNT